MSDLLPKENLPVEPDLSGRRVGAWQIERLLGRGGMGAVYLAARADGEFSKQVAIKFVQPSVAGAGALERFRAERQLLASIDHPRIARLLDGGTAEDGLPFFIMEFVPGETLEQTLERGPLPIASATRLAVELAEALEAMHRKGLVFRDLKPSNIMFNEQSGVKVLDFGIAKITGGADSDDGAASMTAGGKVIGSPRYMSPEQASGEPLDATSDIFSFGIVIYEALTGHLPFDGETRKEYLANLLVGRLRPLPPGVPEGIRRVISRCLEKSPAKRYGSGEALFSALRQITGIMAVAERPAQTFGLWATMAVIAIAVVGLAAWVIGGLNSGETALLKTPARVVANWPSNETNPRVSPDLKWISFASNRDGVNRLWLMNRTTGEERSIVPPGGDVGYHVWSPASDRIALVGPQAAVQQDLTILGIEGGNPQTFRLRTSAATLVRWIGDGIYYLAGDAGGESLWRLDCLTGGSREITTARGSLALRSVDVSRNEKRIVFVAADQNRVSSLWFADLDGGNAVRLTDNRMDPKYLQWRGASTTEAVYVSEEGGTVDIWQIDVTTRKRQRLTATDGRERGIDVSSDGALVVYGEIRETAHLATLDPAQSQPVVTELTSDSLNDLLPDVSASGKGVVFQRSTTIDTAMGMHSSTIQLGQLGQLGPPGKAALASPPISLGEGYAPEISPDGRFVTYSVWTPDKPTQLWLVDTRDRRSAVLSESFVKFSYNLFPLARTTSTLAWSHGPVLYFLALDSAGCTQVWRTVPSPPGQPPAINQVTHVTEKTAVLGDLRVSHDGSQLSYLMRSQARNASELHVVDLAGAKDRVVWSEGAGSRLASPGWTNAGGVVILRSELSGTVADVAVVTGGKSREVGRLPDATRGSVTLDPERQLLYFSQLRGLVRNLQAFSLVSGQVRQVFEGETHGPAFSGIRVLEDGRLLFSYQRQNHEILSSEFGK